MCSEFIVHGKVQGVGFRAFVRARAEENALTGWARNLPDGTVCVRLCGDKPGVLAVAAALQHGPKWSRVSSVAERELACENPRGFKIL